jgi:hypothetical protein
VKTKWCLLLLALLAGPSWAGDAWVAEYQVAEGTVTKSLVVVRDDQQVEYRLEGEAPRLWRRTSDGIEMRELYPDDRRMIAYSPGDLRTLQMRSDWEELVGIVDPAMRAGLVPKGDSRRFGQRLDHYAGMDDQGNQVALDWLPEAGLPARLMLKTKRAGKGSDTSARLALKSLARRPSSLAFSQTDGLLELDQADLGDMEMNPDVQRIGRHGHAH